MENHERFEQWCTWLDSINEQVQLLVLYRRIFTEVGDIVEKNSALDRDNFYFGFVANAYVDSIVMGIRRQLKVKKESISLMRLLKEIADNAHVLSRPLFEQHYMASANRRLQESARARAKMQSVFAKYADADAQFIDSDRIRSDIAALRQICLTAEDFADKRVAHWDIKHPAVNLTFEDINEALDRLCELVQKYYLLLFGTHMFMNPSPPRPIAELFETAWIKPETKSNEKGA